MLAKVNNSVLPPFICASSHPPSLPENQHQSFTRIDESLAFSENVFGKEKHKSSESGYQEHWGGCQKRETEAPKGKCPQLILEPILHLVSLSQLSSVNCTNVY